MNAKVIRRVGALLAIASVIAAGTLLLQHRVSYVATHGTSMEPGFHAGDLAVVVRSDSYAPGDVVAYRSELLDTLVMHRIVDTEGDTFVLQGDNNSWQDADRPTRAEIVGKPWLRVPHGGRAMTFVSANWPLVAIASFVALNATSVSVQRRRRRTGPPMQSRKETPENWYRRVRDERSVARIAAGALLASLAVTAGAFSLDPSQPARETVPFEHNGHFSYSGTTAPGPVYADGRIDTGDPLYLRLANTVDVQFDYELASDAPLESAAGTITLRAAVADTNGWKQTLDLAPAVDITGPRGRATAPLEVGRLQAMLNEVAIATGARAGSATVEIVADVEMDGILAGERLDEEFAPRLAFQLDALQLRPAWTGATEHGVEMLRPVAPGTVHAPTTGIRRLAAFGFAVPVTAARVAGVGVALASSVALLAAAALGRGRRRDKAAQIAARYGDRIIPVAAASRDGNQAVIDVTSIENLSRLATQYDRLILHDRDAQADIYLFQLDQTVYRYVNRRDTSAPGDSVASPFVQRTEDDGNESRPAALVKG